jgi:hypothetical protein
VNGHGGRRDGAGRKPGALGKATADIKALAQPYGAPAVAELARLAGLTDAPGAQTEAARIAALKELLDRGFGRATQHVAGADDAPPVSVEFLWAPAMPQQPEAALDSEAPTIGAVADDDDAGNVVPLVTWSGSSR